MEGAFLVTLDNNKDITVIDTAKEYTFTKCISFNNCIEYIKKGFDLDELEQQLIKAELIKQKGI